MKQVEIWFRDLQEIWISKDYSSVSKLVAPEFLYYESPFEEPITSLSELETVWEEIKEQDIVELKISVLSQTELVGMASYQFICKDSNGGLQEFRGAYFIKLNEEGKALEFRQWWMNK